MENVNVNEVVDQEVVENQVEETQEVVETNETPETNEVNENVETPAEEAAENNESENNQEVNENTETNEVQNEEAAPETPKLELLPEGTEYRDVAKVAKELGLSYVGQKKEALLQKVNEEITKINSGEVSAPAEVTIPTPSNENKKAGNEKSNSPAKEAAQRSARTQTERTVRQASKKWFEEPGAYPYNAGDVVEIIGGKDLIGRMLEVIEPSAKKDMVKGRLVHPVTGKLQNTVIAIAFERIELRNPAAGTQQPTEEEVTNPVEEVNETPVVEEESITAGSEDQVDIPSMDTDEEEVEQQKAE